MRSCRAVGGGSVILVLAATMTAGCIGAGDRPQERAGSARVTSAASTDEHHDALAGLLRLHVGPDGRVDYAALRRERAALDAVATGYANVALDAMTPSGRLATLLNAYNVFTLQLIVEHPEVATIRDIPEAWTRRRWRVGGRTVSLDELEKSLIRSSTDDARFHFALVCAAVGCPPLLAEPFTAESIETQLDARTRLVHRTGRWFRHDEERGELWLTPLYDWYAEDFRRDAGSVLEFVARYAPSVRRAIDEGRPPGVRWKEYDWSLNARE